MSPLLLVSYNNGLEALDPISSLRLPLLAVCEKRIAVAERPQLSHHFRFPRWTEDADILRPPLHYTVNTRLGH